MLIRIAVAISKKEQEEQLVFKLTGLSMVLKNEFDIALYSNDFDRLLDNIKNIDIVISDFTVLVLEPGRIDHWESSRNDQFESI